MFCCSANTVSAAAIPTASTISEITIRRRLRTGFIATTSCRGTLALRGGALAAQALACDAAAQFIQQLAAPQGRRDPVPGEHGEEHRVRGPHIDRIAAHGEELMHGPSP